MWRIGLAQLKLYPYSRNSSRASFYPDIITSGQAWREIRFETRDHLVRYRPRGRDRGRREPLVLPVTFINTVMIRNNYCPRVYTDCTCSNARRDDFSLSPPIIFYIGCARLHDAILSLLQVGSRPSSMYMRPMVDYHLASASRSLLFLTRKRSHPQKCALSFCAVTDDWHRTATFLRRINATAWQATRNNQHDIYPRNTQRAQRAAMLLPSFRSPRLCNYDFIFMDINYTGCLAVSLYGILIQGCRHNGNPRHTDSLPYLCIGEGREPPQRKRQREKKRRPEGHPQEGQQHREHQVGNARTLPLCGSLVRSVFASTRALLLVAWSPVAGLKHGTPHDLKYCLILTSTESREYCDIMTRIRTLPSGRPVNNCETCGGDFPRCVMLKKAHRSLYSSGIHHAPRIT